MADLVTKVRQSIADCDAATAAIKAEIRRPAPKLGLHPFAERLRARIIDYPDQEFPVPGKLRCAACNAVTDQRCDCDKPLYVRAGTSFFSNLAKRKNVTQESRKSSGTFHLYRHFDADGRLLYVGASINAVRRLANHRDEAAWFERLARIEVEHFIEKDDMLIAEAEAIKAERPEFNFLLRPGAKRMPPREWRPGKRGRKPIFDRPMTAAERQRRRRAKAKR